MVAPDPIAYFKTLRLGDIIEGNPSMTVAGEGVDIKSALYATRATANDRGARSWFEYEVLGQLHRSYSVVETFETFLQRKVDFIIAARSARGNLPTTALNTSGILAVGDNAQNLYKLVGSESAGANVTIEISAPDGGPLPITTASGQKWYIFDPGTYAAEIITLTGTGPLSSIEAQTLVNNYTSAARCFRVIMAVPGCFLEPGVALPGADEEGINDGVKGIAFKFIALDPPTYGPAP